MSFIKYMFCKYFFMSVSFTVSMCLCKLNIFNFYKVLIIKCFPL